MILVQLESVPTYDRMLRKNRVGVVDVERLSMEAQKDRGNQQAFGDGVMDVGYVTHTPGTSKA
jgi:hypothetical protein